MNTNRRKFLGAIGGTGVVSAIAVGQANAQSPKPPQTVPSASAAPANRELTGKVAIITGARNNLGRGYAVALARNGADVVVHYHREATSNQAKETARLVQQQGTRALLVSGDLSQVTNVKKLFDETMKAFGRVDIVVHNAGVMVKKPLAEVTEADYDRAAGINSKGTFFIMQEAIRRFEMKTRNAFTTLTICVLSVLTIAEFVNPHKVVAQPVQPIQDCRQLVTGTYLTTISADFGTSRGITTFNRDRNFVATSSIQSGVPNIPPFSDTQGRWQCISDREISATGLAFNYPTATLPASIIRTDFRAIFDRKDRTWKGTTTLRTFPLNANPLTDNAPVVQTFTVTGQRLILGQPNKQ